MCQAVHESGYKLSLSQRSLRSARQRASMDRVVTISVNRNHEAVMVRKSDPPQRGRWTVMAYGKQCRPGKSFQNTIANTQHVPSFIGEDAAIRLIGLSQRSSETILAKLRDMQKTIVFANLYSQVPPYKCCLRQRNSL